MFDPIAAQVRMIVDAAIDRLIAVGLPRPEATALLARIAFCHIDFDAKHDHHRFVEYMLFEDDA